MGKKERTNTPHGHTDTRNTFGPPQVTTATLLIWDAAVFGV